MILWGGAALRKVLRAAFRRISRRNSGCAESGLHCLTGTVLSPFSAGRFGLSQFKAAEAAAICCVRSGRCVLGHARQSCASQKTGNISFTNQFQRRCNNTWHVLVVWTYQERSVWRSGLLMYTASEE